jgi:hypothetical protein
LSRNKQINTILVKMMEEKERVRREEYLMDKEYIKIGQELD